ncbi:TspO/MBR family protein [Aurantimonas endophytica]|uniref:Tryptophan-rich sensory protein n=1 Tax=Aurantimonas endophytica TaxID=1522175 RepID=A0A7W6HB94_9HYPH|nr:TspO/MBR family protein [Aurantimonas endophytica]MBB4001912.1 tryptophan-rich sensory protein [Aurantimonas endophytica]MCO6402454.1 sensory protein TspO [Aurantimonas endophytica]
MSLPSLLTLGVFIVLVFAVAMSGAIFKPGPWYQRLDKPSWTPPNWAFPVVWSALYVMIAVAGWRVYETAGLVALPFAVYGLQLVLNFAWSWLFFGIRRPDLAFVDVVLMALAIAANIALFAPIDAIAAWLMVPYLVWAIIAACLNRSVWRRNPQEFARA